MIFSKLLSIRLISQKWNSVGWKVSTIWCPIAKIPGVRLLLTEECFSIISTHRMLMLILSCLSDLGTSPPISGLFLSCTAIMERSSTMILILGQMQKYQQLPTIYWYHSHKTTTLLTTLNRQSTH
jgi:hypothetical protein